MIALDGVRFDQIKDFPMFKNMTSKGTLFTNVITYAPHSIASFYSIFTGIYGCHNGVNSYFGTPKFKENECKTITEYMKELGYTCFGDSMNDLIVPKKGFDYIKEQKAFQEFFDSHRDIISEIRNNNDNGKLCFVHLHCSYLHNDVVHEFIKKYKNNEDGFYKNKENNIKLYRKFLDKIDNYVKKIMNILEENNLIENSVIIFFSDHGTSLGEKKGETSYGNFCYDITLKTFFLFLNKELFPVKIINQMVRNVDIVPTLLELIGVSIDRHYMDLDGKSLMDFIKSSDQQKKRIAFCETGGISGQWPSPKEPVIHCIRTDEWKLVYNRIPNTYELYDLRNDLNEENNLVDKNIDKEAVLKAVLRDYMNL